MLSLIVRNPSSNPKVKTTLIVSPLSTLENWRSEIESKIDPEEELSFHLNYGKDKVKKWKSLMKYDIVLTTYGLISSAYKKNAKELEAIEWYRIILDEAHVIKNQKAQVTQAISSLKAVNRWCLTGTPIQNHLDDMYSLLHFLQVKDFSDRSWWNSNIASLINSKNSEYQKKGFFRLQVLNKNNSTYKFFSFLLTIFFQDNFATCFVKKT